MLGLNVGLSIAAAIAAAVGAACLWWRKSMAGEMALMASMETSKAAEVAALPPGTLVELKGTLRCGNPLISEFARERCVYFRSEIEREEVYYDRDSDGKERRNTRKTTLHSSIKHTICQVQDDSGTVPIDLEGADVEAVRVLSGYGYPANSKAGDGALGSVANVLASLARNVSEQEIRHYELVLGVDVPAYVLGEVHPGGTIGKPAKGSPNKTFVVSYKSEEERVKDLSSTMTWVFWLAIILFAAAIGLLVWAYNKGPV